MWNRKFIVIKINSFEMDLIQTWQGLRNHLHKIHLVDKSTEKICTSFKLTDTSVWYKSKHRTPSHLEYRGYHDVHNTQSHDSVFLTWTWMTKDVQGNGPREQPSLGSIYIFSYYDCDSECGVNIHNDADFFASFCKFSFEFELCFDNARRSLIKKNKVFLIRKSFFFLTKSFILTGWSLVCSLNISLTVISKNNKN